MSKYVSLFSFLMPGVLALLLIGCAGQQEILNGLNEADANQVVVVLSSKDIDAQKEIKPGRKTSYSIKVSERDAMRALKLLVDNKIPKVQSQGLAQIFPQGSGGLIPSTTQEKAQLMMAMQGEIENMLMVLPGIVQARVVLVLAESNPLRDLESQKKQSTASVAVVYNPVDKEGNPSVTSEDIRSLIASAIPELSASSVTVVMASNKPLKLVSESDDTPALVTATGFHNSISTLGSQNEVVPSEKRTQSSSLPATGEPLASNISQMQEKLDQQNFFMLLFGGIGVVGLLFGLASLFRAISLKKKLIAAESSNSSDEDFLAPAN